jgi:Kef-type K+ transport system membrane component KefB
MAQPAYLPQLPLPVDPLMLFGALVLAGLAAGELVHRALRLPRIVGYVLIGLALGVSGLGIVDQTIAREARVFIDIGLGLILFELGRRLDLNWLRRDRWLAATAVAECTLTFGCIYLALIYFDIQPLHAAVAAAIGITTAPAVVMLVVRELRAEGQVTERALNLVAINSVAGVVLTTMLLSWIHHEYRAGWVIMLSHPLYLLAGSLLLGCVIGGAALLLARWFGQHRDVQLVMLLGLIVVAVGSATALKLSVLLALLAFGVMVRNMDEDHDLMQADIMKFGHIFFVVLFVMTSATLRTSDLIAGGAIAVVYILARFVGKSVGVMSLAYFSGIRPGSGGLLAIALTPMSGTAVVIVHGTTAVYPDFGTSLAAIVLSAVVIMELLGPIAVQYALKKAGEAGEERT